jgi:tellurite resistance protein TehA-like permease
VLQLRHDVPPASWTIVMTSGVVSIDLSRDHQAVLSAIMAWFAALVWLFLAVTVAAPLACQRDRFRREAGRPVTIAGVAATCVLGTRLALQGYRVAAAALLILAAVGWALLLIPILRQWKTPTTGISFVVGVATDGLALLSATLAIAFRAGWLVSVAVVFLLLGLALYVFTAARFDLRQLLTGMGDHWIAGGALAISALAAGVITQAAGMLGQFTQQHQVLATGTLVLWSLALAWVPVLLVCEAVRPRLQYDLRRWATVFPLAMYAACSFTVGQVAGISGISRFGQVETWVAVAATVAVLAGLIRQLWRARPLVGDHGHAASANCTVMDRPPSGRALAVRVARWAWATALTMARPRP